MHVCYGIRPIVEIDDGHLTTICTRLRESFEGLESIVGIPIFRRCEDVLEIVIQTSSGRQETYKIARAIRIRIDVELGDSGFSARCRSMTLTA
jgi:hypothetical protein